MSSPLHKITVTAILLYSFIGFSGCMAPPLYAPPVNAQRYSPMTTRQVSRQPAQAQQPQSLQLRRQQNYSIVQNTPQNTSQNIPQNMRQPVYSQPIPSPQPQLPRQPQENQIAQNSWQPMFPQQSQQQPQNRQVVQNTQQPNLTVTPWYDPFELFTTSSKSPSQSSFARQTAATATPKKPAFPANKADSVNSANSINSVKSNPIAQVAYQTPKKSSEVSLKQRNSVRPSKESPELLKPWNLENFQTKRTVSPSYLNSYRLVADTQESGQKSDSGRTTPPAMSIERLISPLQQTLAQTHQTQTQTQTRTQSSTQSSTTWSEKMPILGVGRDLLKEFRPSNDRKWSQNHAVLQTAEFNGNRVTVHNIRYSKYETPEHFTTQYYDATFNLDDIRTIDLIMVPFRGTPRIAHVESSFGFADGRHLAMSIEARYEEGEKYDPLGAGLRQFELIYVLADERDMIRLGTDVNKNDVHIYRLKFEPNEVKEMFVDALQRANRLAEKPEFYHPLTNSCVTNLIQHINKGRPKAVPKEYRTLLPGLMDHYVYDLKLIDTTAKTFQEAKDNSRVNWLVEKYGDLEYFSAGIRQNMY